MLPLVLDEVDDAPERGDVLVFTDLPTQLEDGETLQATIGERSLSMRHSSSDRQREIVRAGGLVNWLRGRN